MSELPAGVVLAGPESGCGKTIATLAVLQALQQGHTVQPAKAGPDFIDPQVHTQIANRPSRTLDPWLQGTEGLYRTYSRGTGDFCVIEGMMGLYDGGAQSTASVASALELPVILVVDAAARAESVGATALGFAEYGDVEVAGVIAQRAGGGSHEQGIQSGLPDQIEYCGRIPPVSELEVPDRHLGLVSETEVDTQAVAEAAKYLDVETICRIAQVPEAEPPDDTSQLETTTSIAMAQDAAFQFYYPATVELFGEQTSVRTFSPVAGDSVPDADLIYLPGGYPELYARQLADGPTLEEIAAVATAGQPVFGECGGLMALTEELTIEKNTAIDRPAGSYEMAGVLPGKTTFGPETGALGYTELTVCESSPVGDAGRQYRGHEFHRSAIQPAADARFALDVQRGSGINGEYDGLTEYATVGTYSHFHPESGWFTQFLEQ